MSVSLVKRPTTLTPDLAKAVVEADWANESTGDVSSPQGYFWLFTLTEAERPECEQAVDVALPVGNWVIVNDEHGFWHITSFPFEVSAQAAYAIREQRYNEWASYEV
jgi:hypothetical protein